MMNDKAQPTDGDSIGWEERVRQLFDAAMERDPAQRDGFLVSECNGDAELCDEVEALLHHAESDDSFLNLPLDCRRIAPAADEPDPLIGKIVGAYRVMRLIASGGMGTVYLAEQDNPRRLVALKIMHAGFWSQTVRRRFEHEAQILGRLQHPNIAQVYEAGVSRLETGATGPFLETGATGSLELEPGATVPLQYFAMEYVPSARPITRYAEEQGLAIEKRLELFLQVCDAVHYGHQRGVIHRDLKPANILVSAAQLTPGESPRAKSKHGTVKLIDFGVARCTDADIAVTTMHTDAGQLIGTLAYMSPEQCDGDALDLDVRSDVYSLGVVLYELLTAKMPYEVSTTSIVAAARTIRECPPQRSNLIQAGKSRLRGRRAGDLERVIVKALEKAREQRYASVADFARDLRHWTKGEPIDARPPTAVTKIYRWVERHPLATTTAACLGIIASLALGTVISARAFYYAPYRIELDKGEGRAIRAARLVNRMGGTLWTWPEDPTADADAIGNAELVELVERPSSLGGGNLAIVGFRGGGEYANELYAYEVDKDLSVPLWHKQVNDEDMPREMLTKNRRGRDCEVLTFLTADVFPQIEGKELVVVHGLGPYSQRALRVYDLEGKLLYQLWQDGGIKSFSWFPERRRLICLGMDEAEKQHAMEILEARDPVYIVFAIEPKLGVISNEFMTPAQCGGPNDPVWYRYLWPPRYQSEYRAELSGPAQATFGAVAQVNISFETDRHPNVGFAIPIDEHGNEILPSINERGEDPGDFRIRSDLYLQSVADGLVPPDKRFRLSDKPPDIPLKSE